MTEQQHAPSQSDHQDGQEPGRYSQQHGDTHASNDNQGGNGDDSIRVLDPNKAESLRGRWNEVQAGFVDEPKDAVNGADQLVGEILDEVSRVFREQRAELEKTWSGGEGGSEKGTEELRQALRRYREFFDRLLTL